ncbi:hypothetical protein PSTT_12058 [Puccinia striiformis]|uniref:DUF6589 domain-containing protein n=1 Tax=Puccinia striiformis TaxID=27350 RepID=A0A2S4UXR3_9BASI|nr:hypothetical protein PSTT_12058 [Puccinia striiformis]
MNANLPSNDERMQATTNTCDPSEPTKNLESRPDLSAAESEELAWDGYVLASSGATSNDKLARATHMATVACSMFAFAQNRRANGLQLTNSVRFLACGVSKTVNEYTHHLGLCSSRKTDIQALQSLTRDSQDQVINVSSNPTIIAPPICIDNLDMEQRIHQPSVGRQTQMFHGTWGYVHVPSKSLMDTLNPAELTLEAYHESLKKAASITIEPHEDFLPSDSSGEEYALVMKSQIAQVMFDYVARPTERKNMLPLHPPAVKQITAKVPEIHMLKLMDESDNSAEGIGQVMEALQRQSGLNEDEFFGRLQLVDGDLGTNQICWNFAALILLLLSSQKSPLLFSHKTSLGDLFYSLNGNCKPCSPLKSNIVELSYYYVSL